MVSRIRSILRLALIAAVFACGLLPTSSYAQAQAKAVSVSAEPHHRIRFDNGKVRMYEAVLPKGESTLWHRHSADGFQLFFSSSSVIVEPKGGPAATYPVFPGLVVSSSGSVTPYTHRVEGGSETPFHVIDMEFLAPPSGGGGGNAAARRKPPFSVALESGRGRAYRVILKPGESTGTFHRPAKTAIFAISSGRISEHVSGKAPRLWDFDPGDFHWSDFPESLSLKNESSTSVQLMEIEVF
jgi:hypothetical protein